MAIDPYEPTFYLLKRRLPSSETENTLGRLVRRFQDPARDYTPSSPAETLTPDVFRSFLLGIQYDESAKLTARAAKDDKLLGKLKGLLTLSKTAANVGAVNIISPRITTYRLKLVDDYFAALKKVPAVRRKMIDMCPIGGKIYLVVGIMTIHTAEVKQSGSQHKEIGAEGTVPVATGASMAVAAVSGGLSIPATTGRALDILLETGHSTSSDWTVESTVTARGENGEIDESAEEIFAIAYREIARNWMGMGKDAKIREKGPEYTGGQHFGQDDSDEEDDDDEREQEAEAIAVEELQLTDNSLTLVSAGQVGGQVVMLDSDSGFLFHLE